MQIREWQTGDDLRLLEIFSDPLTAQHHHDRAMLGPATQDPFGIGLVAVDDGIPVAAGVVRAQALHPKRMWCFIETAPLQRHRGIGTQLLEQLRTHLDDTTALKTRSVVGDVQTADWLQHRGFNIIQQAKRIMLPAQTVDTTGVPVEELATGSVALSKVVAEYYNATHQWDPAELSITQAQQLFLAPHTGAQQALVTREGQQIVAFGIAYPGPIPNVVELFIGYDPQHSAPAPHVQALVAFAGQQRSLAIELDRSTTVLNAVLEAPLEAEVALLEHESLIWATDA